MTVLHIFYLIVLKYFENGLQLHLLFVAICEIKKRMVYELLQKSKHSDFINLLQIHDTLRSGAWKETRPQND
jgi:hypothetical protein